jgi:hypothetical protein
MSAYTMYSALCLYGRLYYTSFKISLARINAAVFFFFFCSTKLNSIRRNSSPAVRRDRRGDGVGKNCPKGPPRIRKCFGDTTTRNTSDEEPPSRTSFGIRPEVSGLGVNKHANLPPFPRFPDVSRTFVWVLMRCNCFRKLDEA